MSSFAQKELNVSLNGGFTIGDIEPKSSIAFGADANYLFDWFLDFTIGPSLSFIYFSPSSDKDIKPFIYLPVGGAIRFQAIEDEFYVGGDFGYAMGISPNGDRGGIYFKPIIGYNVNDSFKVNLFYSAIKKKQPAYSYVGIGLTYDFLGASSGNFSF